MADTDIVAKSETEHKPKPITFKTFLEDVPPNREFEVVEVHRAVNTNPNSPRGVGPSRLWLYCDTDVCTGHRYFDQFGEYTQFEPFRDKNVFLTYRCSNCKQTLKKFALRIIGGGSDNPAHVTKYGEVPAFGPPVPNRLLRLLEEGGDKELFLKGRQCENQGLGVGAFSYYRQVVENKKNALIKEILKVADTLDAPAETKESLNAAMKEHRFKASMEMIKDAIPESLLINGQNPMTLLHSALSEGLHDLTDQHCLELATSIRLVLSELVKRVSEARKENAELLKAVSKLSARPKGK